MSQQWWALGLALFSLGLAIGWAWVKKLTGNDFPWPALSQQWPGGVARFFYFVGLPYVAVIFGLLPPSLLGLKGLENFVLIDWAGGLVRGQQAFVAVQYALVLMLLEWLIDSSYMVLAGLAALMVLAGIRLSLARAGIKVGAGVQTSVLSTLYYGLHWAFYRATFWLVTDDLYLGTVLGVGFVVLEWMLIAWIQKNRPTDQKGLINIIILILTATVFFYSPNLWLLWPLHLAMVMLINRTGPVRPVDNLLRFS